VWAGQPYATSVRPVTSRRLLRGTLCAALLLGAGAIGCGGSDSESADMPPPPAKPEDFPKARGKTLVDLLNGVGQEGPILSPSVSQLESGRNRFGFGLFDRARAQIADAPAAVYVARAGGGEARGPFPARYESLDVKPQFRSRTSSSDPDSARLVYAADVDFGKPGNYEVLGIVRLDGRLVAARPSSGVKVQRDVKVPEVGETAPRIHTPTPADVGGDLSRIDTRDPPSDMHDTDLADVLGKKPAVLQFATPALCQSRVCGPVVDIAEQVKAERGDDAAFIHMEVYNDNEIAKGFRPQVGAYRLRSEPWLFVIDAQGKIAARLEGAFSARELDQALDRAVR